MPSRTGKPNREESRAAVKRRLEASGHWGDFVRRREGYKKQGMTAAEAHKAAVALFPPGTSEPAGADNQASPATTPNLQEPPAVDTTPREPTKTVLERANSLRDGESERVFPDAIQTERDVIRWVAAQLPRVKSGSVTWRDAPSAAAWGLMEWVLLSFTHEGDFYRNLWPKVIAKGDDDDGGGIMVDDGRDAIELAERVLARIRRAEERRKQSAL